MSWQRFTSQISRAKMISDLYEKAIEFAAKAHQGQMRKGQDVPYIVHPFTVSAILKEQNCDEHVIIAGLLHDTVEDTAVSLESLRFDFGDQIADLVAICTEPDKGLPWGRTKATYAQCDENSTF